MKDANGIEIKIGDWVMHRFQPHHNKEHGRLRPDCGAHWHNFGGAAKVIGFASSTCVLVRSAYQQHMPVHLGSLVVKIDEPGLLGKLPPYVVPYPIASQQAA